MKKEIKQQNPKLSVTVIDVLAEVDPSKSNKYLPFLVRQINKKLEGKNKELERGNYDLPYGEKADCFIKLLMYHMLTNGDLLSNDEVRILHQFHFLMEKKRIDETDVNKYETFEEMRKASDAAVIKYEYKDKEKGVSVILDNDDYLILRPLTYESSVKYGSNTKWCTAANTTRVQFDEYTRNGILIYIINKKTTDKVALHIWINGDGELRPTTFWNAADKQIDSIESDVDLVVLHNLLKEVKEFPRTNYSIAKELGLVDDSEDMYMKKASFFEDRDTMPNPPAELVGWPEEPLGIDEGMALEPQMPNDMTGAAPLFEEIAPMMNAGMGGNPAHMTETVGQNNQGYREAYDRYRENHITVGIRRDEVDLNPCGEIFLGESKDCMFPLPPMEEKPVKGWKKFLKRFKKKKNILILSYQTRIDGEQAHQMMKQFENHSLSKDFDMVIFNSFDKINFDAIGNGESVPARS